MGKALLCLVVSLCALLYSTHGYLVSFYGDSFLFQPVESGFRDTTTISLRFLTSAPDGILLYVVGQSQYLLIELVSGNLKVKIDLGFGEEVLSTLGGSTGLLNNLIWHDFKVVRSGKNVKIVLNGKDVASGWVSATSKEKAKFHIGFGVFVGGLGGNVTSLDFSQPKFFRGCMLEAEIDGRDLLAPTGAVTNERIVYNVLSGCPRQFRADRSEPIYFDSLSSHVALRRWTAQDEGTFECMIKTSGQRGIILYNAGRGRGEFIGLEMEDGIIGASVNKGGGVVGLRSTSPVNDGSWHSVRFSFSPSYLDIRVDGKRTKAFIEETSSEDFTALLQHRNLDLTGHLYIGGVPSRRIGKDKLKLGWATVGGSFPGCIKNIRVNHRRRGFPDFITSRKVSADCSSVTLTAGDDVDVDDYQKAHDAVSKLFVEFYSKLELHRITSTATVATVPSRATTTEAIMLPSPQITTGTLSVLEGKFSKISQSNINMTFPIKLNSNKKNILFVVTEGPTHGYLVKSDSCDGNNGGTFNFTLGDIISGLLYCHYGGEAAEDLFYFSVVWNLLNKSLEERKYIISQVGADAEYVNIGLELNGGRTYPVHISVVPHDDHPTLSIPVDYIFQPIKLVMTHLPRSILNASDPDSSRDQVIYAVLENGGNAEFQIKNTDNLGQAISEFTQVDIDQSKIVFVAKGSRDHMRLFLRLSNAGDEKYSTTIVLRVAPVELEISVFTRPLRVLEKTAIVLTTDFVRVQSNAEPGSVSFQISVKRKPSLGAIEILSSGLWAETNSFMLEDVADGNVRYRNIRGGSGSRTELTHLSSVNDSLAFTVEYACVVSELINVDVEVKLVDVEFIINPVLLDGGLQERAFKGGDFNITFTLISATNSQIQVMLGKTPHHLIFFYNDNGLMLHKDDAFTLEEVTTGRVSMRVALKYATRAFQELVPLQAVVNNVFTSGIISLNITYIPDLERILLVNEGLVLDEGQEQVITTKLLEASLPQSPVNDKVKIFRYRVINHPNHGVLTITKEDGTRQQIGNVNEFTSLDLEQNKVYYRHDDSESSLDFFSFQVTPVLVGQLPQTVAKLSTAHLDANFSIVINLVNDQRPLRIVNRPFEIVRNGERLLTKDDLWYHDADSDYDDLDLSIARRGIKNGIVVNAISRRHEEIFRFTQRQIVNGEVLFKHRGDDSGRFVFWVRDGKHYATGLFIITASDPFVKIINSTALEVIKSSYRILSNWNLASKTNVEGLLSDIVYTITTHPQNGLLYVNTSSVGNRAAVNFTQQDINDGLVVYEHSGSPVMDDALEFKVSAGEYFAYGNISVKVYHENHDKPPAVQKNRTITVAQGVNIQIRKQDLRVTHPNTRAADIVYTIIAQPSKGKLQFKSEVKSLEFNSQPVTDFTQADINRGLVWYSQDASVTYDESDFFGGLLLDHFLFNVTNGVWCLSGLRLYFDIIPDIIPLRLQNFSVLEGRSKAILQEYMHIDGLHYDDENIEIELVTAPSHGIFESTQRIGVSLKKFNYQLAVAEFLYYAHDGSDSIQDQYTVQACTADGKRCSSMVDGYISIIPENDESPVVINNTGLNVWTNSVTELSPIELAVGDLDSEPRDLNFQILPPSNGWVALRIDPTRPILNFTQLDIIKNLIVFVHKGASTGGFTFQADDGINYSTKGIFVITARPLIISVQDKSDIKAFPGYKSSLPARFITSITNDVETPMRLIMYIITTPPKYGSIVNKVKPGIELSNFTQYDVDNAVLMYDQNKSFKLWSEVDSFIVSATCPPADDVVDIKIMVNISYDVYKTVGKSSPLKVNQGYTIEEGGRFVLNTTLLDGKNLYQKLPLHKDRRNYDLTYTLTNLPANGNLSISGEIVEHVNTSFKQTDLEFERIVYSHDHSDTMMDSFELNVCLTDRRFSASTGKPWIVPGTDVRDVFNISITPLNDNPPKITTKGKVLKVVNGFETVITSEMLNANDPDTPPDNITYSIIRPPVKGIVVLKNSTSGSALHFSQKDINELEVIFMPSLVDALQSSQNDVFYYGLTDGVHRPVYNLFRIMIVPIFVSFCPQEIELRQASYSTTLSPTHLNASTNGDYFLISFEVVSTPKAGIILLNDQETNEFSYRDLEMGKVTYTMTSNIFSNDSFEINMVYDILNDKNKSKLEFVTVAVKPLLEQGSFSVSNNGLTRIDLSALNSEALYVASNSMPVYLVTLAPQFIKILKASSLEDRESNLRSKRDISFFSDVLHEVQQFTHADVGKGIIFVAAQLNATTQPIHESVGMRLTVSDESVQPSDFMFEFDIVEKTAEDYGSFIEQFLPETEGEKATSTEGRERNEYPTTSAVNHSMTDRIIVQPSKVWDSGLKNESSYPTVKPKIVASTDSPEPAKASVSWLTPVGIVAALIVILIITLTIVMSKRSSLCRKSNGEATSNDENQSLTHINNSEKKIKDDFNDPSLTNASSSVLLQSPACPGVMVTLLQKDPLSDTCEVAQPSVYGIGHRHSISASGTAVGHRSCRDDNQSTIYSPSTVYHYDDVGSIDFAAGTDAEFYAADRLACERNYGTGTAKFIDPDVLALYSSDESIPSMLDEKYAVSCDDGNILTGSVPSCLHRSTGQDDSSHLIAASRSTHSLSKPPELSLLPKSQLESNQYWI